MMELIRAYAEKVAGYLPKKVRQDTADELYDSLCEQYEDSPEEQRTETEFLQGQPHPIGMATRLSDRESLHLIGPAYYLSFIEAIKIAAIVVAVFHVGLFGLAAWGSGSVLQALFQTLANFPGVYLHVLFIIGIVFVVLEKSGERVDWLEKWDVRELQREAGKQKISKGETLFELSVSAIAFMWLIGAIELPPVVRHDGVWLNNLVSQIPELLIIVILVVLAVDLIVSVTKLIRSVWSTNLRVISLSLDVVWMVLLAMLIQIDPIVTQEALTGIARVDDVLQVINNAIDVSLSIAILIIGWDAISHLIQLLRRSKLDTKAVV